MHVSRFLKRSAGLITLLACPLVITGCEPLPEDNDGRGSPVVPACDGYQCPTNSTCTVVDDDPFCDCNEGFIGSPGVSASACYPATTDTGTCRDTDDGIVCDCNEGYSHAPNAVECSLLAASCEELACDVNANCQQMSAGYTCVCKPNYEGDGRTCTPVDRPTTCAELNCDVNATCQVLAAGATCQCKPGYSGDGETCTFSGVPCGGVCKDNATCVGEGLSATCQCDTGYFGDGATGCYPEVTATGTCTMNAAGTIACQCLAGYEHLPMAVACTDINECQLPDQGGCEAWCTNTDGASTCTSTVADENSPYWKYSCDPGFSHFADQTNLIADCRCGANQLVAGPLGLCQRPTSAYERGFAYGSGPRVTDLYANLPRVPAGVMDQATRKIYLGFGYTTPGDSYIGAIMEIDVDTGARRIVAGLWPDEFGGTVYGTGIEPYLPEVQNLAIGPDGYLYAWARNERNNAQIIRVDRTTGAMTLVWAEHITTLTQFNNPAHAQCPNGTTVPGSRSWVQINERGFLIEASGDFILSAMSTNAGVKSTPIGLVRVSKDGTSCEWVRRTNGGSDNAFASSPIGSGASPQVPFRSLYAHKGKVWAIDNFAEIYELDPANNWRTRNFASDIAEDWMAWDERRQVMWFAGSGGGSNVVVAYHPSDIQAERWAEPITCDNPSREGFGCIEGPARTCCLNHNPMFFDELTGHVILQHDIFGTLRVEVETGNTVTFSL